MIKKIYCILASFEMSRNITYSQNARKDLFNELFEEIPLNSLVLENGLTVIRFLNGFRLKSLNELLPQIKTSCVRGQILSKVTAKFQGKIRNQS